MLNNSKATSDGSLQLISIPPTCLVSHPSSHLFLWTRISFQRIVSTCTACWWRWEWRQQQRTWMQYWTVIHLTLDETCYDNCAVVECLGDHCGMIKCRSKGEMMARFGARVKVRQCAQEQLPSKFDARTCSWYGSYFLICSLSCPRRRQRSGGDHWWSIVSGVMRRNFHLLLLWWMRWCDGWVNAYVYDMVRLNCCVWATTNIARYYITLAYYISN